jgi:hypothetical protein
MGGQTQWSAALLPAAWQMEVGQLLSLGVQDQPGQHSETLSQTKKIKKLEAYLC